MGNLNALSKSLPAVSLILRYISSIDVEKPLADAELVVRYLLFLAQSPFYFPIHYAVCLSLQWESLSSIMTEYNLEI